MVQALEKTYEEVDRSLWLLLEDGSCRRTADMAALAAVSRGLEAVFKNVGKAPAAGAGQTNLERQLQQAKEEAVAEAEERVAAEERLAALEKELADVKEDYAALKAIQERESSS